MRINLTLQDKTYPATNTLGAQIDFNRRTGKDLDVFEKVIGENGKPDIEVVDLMAKFIWCCAASTCRREGITFDFPFDTFADYLLPEDLLGLIKIFGSEGNQ